MLMHPEEHLLIIGASARAAAFSALRAGLRPWCADLFADADLRARCPVVALPPDRYPQGFVEVLHDGPPGPWLYTGGLENRPALVGEIALQRPLWGNDEHVLRLARSPWTVAAILHDAELPCPAVRTPWQPPRAGRWLVKPLAGAGGSGIRLWTPGEVSPKRGTYLQEFVEGEPCAAVYVGDGMTARLLGVTAQMVGEDWLHAAPFHYCGSVGPLSLDGAQRQAFEQLGCALADGCGLRGLFGVDCLLRDGTPWPVEINPRYTASVEVLEHALQLPALALHRQVFEPTAAVPSLPGTLSTAVIGKAILFARAPLVFPEDGPWTESLQPVADVDELPAFADIPIAGQSIKADRPILTFFVRGDSAATCRDALRQRAEALDRRLFA